MQKLINKRNFMISSGIIVLAITIYIVIYIYVNKNGDNNILTSSIISNSNVINSNIIKSEDILYKINNNFDLTFNADDVNATYNASDLVVIGTIIRREKPYLPEGFLTPLTPGNIQVDKVIKGKIDSNILNFQIVGGIITIDEYISVVNKIAPTSIEKMGVNKLSDTDKKKYIQIDGENTNDFEVGIKYILMLKQTGDKSIVLSYCGMISLDESENKQISKTELNSKEDLLKLNKPLKQDKLTYGFDIK